MKDLYCCKTPTFEIVWDNESTEIALKVCSCWPNAAEVNNLVVWSETGNGEAVRHAVAWVMKWVRDRGVGCWADYSDRYLAEDNAYGQGVLGVRVTFTSQQRVGFVA
jgi:hypothetical protein